MTCRQADVTASLILLAEICCNKQSSGRGLGFEHGIGQDLSV